VGNGGNLKFNGTWKKPWDTTPPSEPTLATRFLFRKNSRGSAEKLSRLQFLNPPLLHNYSA